MISAFVLAGAACGEDDGDGDETGEVVFDITLSPASEVPACASAGAAASGTVVVTIAGDESAISVPELSVSGLSSAVIGAHIHSGAPGIAGPIVFDLGSDPTSLSTRIFTSANYPSPPGAPETFDAFVVQMKAGGTYVNVHTQACPSGEVRGQLANFSRPQNPPPNPPDDDDDRY